MRLLQWLVILLFLPFLILGFGLGLAYTIARDGFAIARNFLTTEY